MPTLLELVKEQWNPSPAYREKMQQVEASLGANPEVLTGDPGGAPGGALLSMIPNPRNLGKFKALMQAALKKTPAQWPEELRQAEAFMRARHPKLMERAYVVQDPKLKAIGESQTLPGGFNRIAVGKPSFAKDRLLDYIDTLAHEGLHGTQKPGAYIQPPESLTNLKQLWKYLQQPVEKSARRAGRTAAKSFDKFLDLTGF